MKRIAILFNEVRENAPKDDSDVLIEVDAVFDSLRRIGHDPVLVPFSIDIPRCVNMLKEIKPDIVFNLVESVDGNDRLASIAPMLLEHLRIPYTGSGPDAIDCTTNKILSKRMMENDNILIPEYQKIGREDIGIIVRMPCILKSVYNHASVGINDDSIFFSDEDMRRKISCINERDRKNWFIEEFVNGREFNISVIEEHGLPYVLTPVEIVFNKYPEDKPKIVGYKAKWEEDSFEYKNTIRKFIFDENDDRIIERMTRISKDCWNLFDLKGYARIDFRVDGIMPMVLEVNANPCISPDAGLAFALEKNGIKYNDFIRENIESAERR